MNWNQLEYVVRSESGQDGVYFISDGFKRQVLKAPESPASELFLTYLANSFGLDTPEIIEVIRPDSSEYKAMIKAIKPNIDEQNAVILEAQRKEENKDEFERDRELMEKRILDVESPHIFFLMENINGRSLRDATKQDMEEWYGNDEELNEKGRFFFKDLGKLLVFDILIRNVDRFIFWKLPGIGELEEALGNIGNIMVRDETKQLTVIDSLTNREIKVAEYAKAVKEAIARTLNSESDNLIDRGKETIELTGYEVKENGTALMLVGIREGINYIHQYLTRGETLVRIKDESLRQLSDSEEGIDQLIEFIKRIAREGFSGYSDRQS